MTSHPGRTKKTKGEVQGNQEKGEGGKEDHKSVRGNPEDQKR